MATVHHVTCWHHQYYQHLFQKRVVVRKLGGIAFTNVSFSRTWFRAAEYNFFIMLSE